MVHFARHRNNLAVSHDPIQRTSLRWPTAKHRANRPRLECAKPVGFYETKPISIATKSRSIAIIT